MKKRLTKITALFLAVLLLAGCSYSDIDSFTPEGMGRKLGSAIARTVKGLIPGEYDRENPVAFDDMVYARPDMDELIALAAAVEEQLESGRGVAKTMAALDDFFDAVSTYTTMYEISSIRYYLDLTDDYYQEEYEWCDEHSSEVDQLLDELYYSCAASSQAKQLENRYFWDGFCEDYANSEDTIYTDEVVELLAEESRLISEYYELTTDPVITIGGEELNYYEYMDEISTWEEYNRALNQYYAQYGELLGSIYISLVKVRNEIARSRGYDSYQEMEYELTWDREYTTEETALYLENVKKYLVPVYEAANANGTLYRYSLGSMDERELMNYLTDVAGKVGDEAVNALKFMKEYNLYDVSCSDTKANMSFVTYLSDYEEPYLFVNAEESAGDCMTIVHEFGHFLDAYINFNGTDSLDLCECFSTGLEMLSLTWIDDLTSHLTARALKNHKMSDALETFTFQGALAEFEIEAYKLPESELTLENLDALSYRLSEEYGLLEEGWDMYFSRMWIDVTHIYEYPFYVFSYITSADAAMQLYENEEQNGTGKELYFKLMTGDYDYYLDAVTGCGLENPFSEEHVAALAECFGKYF